MWKIAVILQFKELLVLSDFKFIFIGPTPDIFNLSEKETHFISEDKLFLSQQSIFKIPF